VGLEVVVRVLQALLSAHYVRKDVLYALIDGPDS
jgi:hypothetical protein